MNLKPAIDVSSYQGHIDWKQVKQAGIEAAILRGVIKNGNLDASFERNYTGATQNGVRLIGVYHYSYALTVEKAKNDAINMIQKLNHKKLTIWLDLEWPTQRALGKKQVTALAQAYVNTCKALGYTCHIYSNLDWYKNVYDPQTLKRLGCQFWIARYPAQDTGIVKKTLKPNIGECLWQYSSKGKIAGIKGNVDMNLICDDTILATGPVSFLTPATSAAKLLGKVNTRSSNLNIRALPDTASAIVGSYKKGEVIELLDKTSSNWYRTHKGYVFGDYITPL